MKYVIWFLRLEPGIKCEEKLKMQLCLKVETQKLNAFFVVAKMKKKNSACAIMKKNFELGNP